MATKTLYDEDGLAYEVEVPDPEDTEGGRQQRTNQEWAALRKEKKRGDEAERERDALKRQMAFLRAGIDVDDPKMAYFVKGYEGDATPDAVKEAAIKAGFIEAPPAPVTPDPTADPVAAASLAAGQRIAEAAGGAGTDPMSNEQRLEEAFKRGGQSAMLEEAIKMGMVVTPPR